MRTSDVMPRVTLRPVSSADLELFEADFSSAEVAGPYQWFGFRSVAAFRGRFAENGLLSDDGGTLTVHTDGQVAGRVDWFKSRWGPPQTSWCWTIGVGLRPDHRGHGVGTEAHRQLVAYLFAYTRAHRIQAYTDGANRAEQRALEKAGFEREGILRQAQWRGGRWHDQILYSVIRPGHGAAS